MRAIVLGILLAIAATTGTIASAPPPLGVKTDCTGGRPCWDWYTLSNNQRTVHLVGRDDAVLVTPCRFQWFDYNGRIDWARTSRRRGDNIARAHGCDPRFYDPELNP